MAKTYRLADLNDTPVRVALSEMSVKERVRRAHQKHTSLVGFTDLPRLTAEMKRDIALGRPIINQ